MDTWLIPYSYYFRLKGKYVEWITKYVSCVFDFKQTICSYVVACGAAAAPESTWETQDTFPPRLIVQKSTTISPPQGLSRFGTFQIYIHNILF